MPTRREAGASLVELSIALLVGAIVAATMALWASSVGRAEREHRAEDGVLADLRFVKELLSKDLRSARGFFATEPEGVSLWLDGDRDGSVGVGETVTWSITSAGELTRQIDSTVAGAEATSLDVAASGFAYLDPLPGTVREVSFTLVATFNEGGAEQRRGVASTVSVRNATGSP